VANDVGFFRFINQIRGIEKIKRIHKIAQKFFVEQLAKHPEAKKYLNEQRKLSDEMISEFGIGYAPDSHYMMIQELKGK